MKIYKLLFLVSNIRYKDFRPSPSRSGDPPGFWSKVDWRAMVKTKLWHHKSKSKDLVEIVFRAFFVFFCFPIWEKKIGFFYLFFKVTSPLQVPEVDPYRGPCLLGPLKQKKRTWKPIKQYTYNTLKYIWHNWWTKIITLITVKLLGTYKLTKINSHVKKIQLISNTNQANYSTSMKTVWTWKYNFKMYWLFVVIQNVILVCQSEIWNILADNI